MWHKINGQIAHWNEPHEGTKYSIIVYQGESKSKKTDHINKAKNGKNKTRKRNRKKEEFAKVLSESPELSEVGPALKDSLLEA
jgi:hypothetical protein